MLNRFAGGRAPSTRLNRRERWILREAVEEVAGDGEVGIGEDEGFEDGAGFVGVGFHEAGGAGDGLCVAGGEGGAGFGALDEGLEGLLVLAARFLGEAVKVNVAGLDELGDFGCEVCCLSFPVGRDAFG